ncbi:MAG: ferrous iron transporter B [Phycisphaerales bacterium]|nr:ferrous iron transporter B [Phycisphaerales bacterium]
MDASDSQPSAASTVLLLGNPNVGKTTLFNRLCGLRSATANFPGSTVEARVGSAMRGTVKRKYTDLPGTYSLNTKDDLSIVCKRALNGVDCQQPDTVVVVADATNLRRNLTIVNEILHHNVRCVVALSMADIAQKSGLTIDCEKLGEHLGCWVVTVNPRSGAGIDDLRTVLDDPRSLEVTLPTAGDHKAVNNWANEIIASSVGGKLAVTGGSLTDRLDKVCTHSVLGLFVFAAVMVGLFWTIFTLAVVPMDLIDSVFGYLSNIASNILPQGAVHDFIVDGLIAGIAGTVVFLPQICLLFFLISLLEDTGYLARAAFVMDRVFRRFGLPGQSFVPFLSAHACAIPAIMAARIVPDRRDRLATILVAPFFSCSARLPVYVLLVGVLFANQAFFAGLAFFGCYALGAGAAFFTAFIMRRTVLQGKSRPMVLELPTYKMPSLRTAVLNTIDRAWVFLKNAGTIILAIVVVLWWLSAYPKVDTTQEHSLDAPTQLSQSYAGKIGQFVTPVFAPLGYDWKLTVGVLTSFAAREVFVSTIAVLVSGSDDVEDETIIDKIERANREDGSPLFNTPTAASLLVFFVLAMQCLPTIAVTRRETGSWNWALLQLGYMTVLAWVSAFITFQIVSGFVS